MTMMIMKSTTKTSAVLKNMKINNTIRIMILIIKTKTRLLTKINTCKNMMKVSKNISTGLPKISNSNTSTQTIKMVIVMITMKMKTRKLTKAK